MQSFHYHQFPASAPLYHSQQQLLYHHLADHPRPQHQHTPSRYSGPMEITTHMQRNAPPRVTPPINNHRWAGPAPRIPSWQAQWSPPRPIQCFSTPQKYQMEDVTPRLPTYQIPLTPEWFPTALPDDFSPPPSGKPQAPLQLHRELSPPSGLLFSSNMAFWEPPSENDVPLLSRSELSSPVSRAVVTPELPTDLQPNRDPVFRESLTSLLIDLFSSPLRYCNSKEVYGNVTAPATSP